jgi:hypothetical protein
MFCIKVEEKREMPVFVEWKWQERFKSFLVIFHFYDDFSRPNLRVKKYEKGHLFMARHSKVLSARKAWMTWAPSHPELALLTELLSYANRINGLKEFEKGELRTKLEGVRKGEYDPETEEYDADLVIADASEILKEIGEGKLRFIYIERDEPELDLRLCVELCQEYIDYLKETIEKYS